MTSKVQKNIKVSEYWKRRRLGKRGQGDSYQPSQKLVVEAPIKFGGSRQQRRKSIAGDSLYKKKGYRSGILIDLRRSFKKPAVGKLTGIVTHV